MEVWAKYVTTLDESIAVALNYEDARGRPSGFAQAGPQLEYPRRGGFQRKWTMKSSVAQPSGQTKQVNERPSKTSTTVGVKRKVTPMAARAWSKSSLNPEQREKARKEGLCFGCLQNHQWKDCPLNKDRRTTAMIISECDTEMPECPDAEHMQMQLAGPSQRLVPVVLSVSVTKLVNDAPDNILSSLSPQQQGIQFSRSLS